jgi:alkanesulfonate monooxygenase SsuD/methylene tetrahydromethanopterin reductase-like flavin-dependent oxidoreductase (luciferase family)
MRFSIWPNPARPVTEFLELARFADQHGWYGMWFADHYMPNTPDDTTIGGDTHEAWAILPALIAVTERIRVGPLVSPTTIHHPALLANRAASLDHLSGGRFVLGLGAGWQTNEHRAYGIDLLEPRVRVDRFAESLSIITSLLSEDRTSFSGTHFEIVDAPCEPKPIQSPLPIVVGTGGKRMLRLLARHAHEWNSWGTPDTVAAVATHLEHACEAEGRPRTDLWTSAQALFCLSDDTDEIGRLQGLLPADRSIVGPVDHIIDEIGRYRELGVDEIIVPDFTLGAEFAERLDNYHRFSSEIMSAFA